MNNWIDLHALWKIVVLGLVAGAGLPAVFALGLRALSLGGPHEEPAAGSPGGSRLATGNPAGLMAAVACFAVVLAAVAYGIYLVVESS